MITKAGRCALTTNRYNSRTWLKAVDAPGNESICQEQSEKGLKWVGTLPGRNGWQRQLVNIKDTLERVMKGNDRFSKKKVTVP